MLSSFRIRSFRGFADVHIPALGRVNLVTGKNNVGKTTLLEAIFLYAGVRNPSLPARIEGMRGRTHYAAHPEGVWGWLFPGKCMTKTIELTGTDENGSSDTLQLYLKTSTVAVVSADDNEGRVDPLDGSAVSTGGPPKELILEHERADGSVSRRPGHSSTKVSSNSRWVNQPVTTPACI